MSSREEVFEGVMEAVEMIELLWRQHGNTGTEGRDRKNEKDRNNDDVSRTTQRRQSMEGGNYVLMHRKAKAEWKVSKHQWRLGGIP